MPGSDGERNALQQIEMLVSQKEKKEISSRVLPILLLVVIDV